MKYIRQTLIDIQESQTYERLEPFTSSAVWTTLAPDERVLLARLLVMQGAQQLAQGRHQALESFEKASQISANDPEILYTQGTIFGSYRDNIRCLSLAAQAFDQVLKKDPSHFKALYAHAIVTTEIGLFEGESSFFLEANKNFENAQVLLDLPTSTVPKENFYWKWGFCLASLGRLSGEPLDFHRSIEKYYKAFELGCFEAPFLNDYGHSYADLASLLEKRDYFTEAVKLFNQAIRRDPRDFQGWYNQGCCLLRLGEYVPYENLLEQGYRSFEKAAEINPDHSQLWLRWGQLEANYGKAKRDRPRIESSLQKYAKAYELEPEHPQVLSNWAETELYLGTQDERLDFLHSAQAKIIRSLEIQPEDPDSWYIYGSCLNELGNYFEDEEFYHQAIEKFQYGLSLANNHPLLWYGSALSYFALGEILDEQELYEKSVRNFGRMIECGDIGFSQFWNDWGVALLKLADITNESSHIELAIEKFDRALKQSGSGFDVDDVDDVDMEWVYNYGCAYDLLGDFTEDPHHFEKAVHILTQVVQLDPNYIQARYNLALALSHLGEATYDVEPYHKAIEHFQYLLDMDPEDEIIHLDFGVSLTNLGLLVEDIHHPERSQTFFRLAETHLMQAAALGNAQSHYQLAGLYSITENYQHAMHHLDKAQFVGGLPGIEDLLHDDWLEGLRRTPAFRQFINDLSSRQSLDEK